MMLGSMYLNQYEIDSTDGDGIASADIQKIPMTDTDDSIVTKFLQEPIIIYSKTNNLRNGEKLEVTIILSKTSVSSDFEYDVWLGSDHLAYVNLKEMEVS